MAMPGRQYSAGSGYRYAFNGKEADHEVSGNGNQYDYGFRIYNSRLGRFLSVDPIAASFPWYTPYQFAGNNPIKFIDLDGLEPADPAKELYKDKPQIDMNGAPANPANAQGFPRNSRYFWNQMSKDHPEYFSIDNAERINNGYSPWVDELWTKSFPGDAPYMDSKLIHHHIQGKNMAVAIPEKMHWEKFSDLHAYLQKAGETIRGIRISGVLNGVINVLGLASDVTGIIKDNPDALGNQFYNGSSSFDDYIGRVVNQHFGEGPFLDQYIVITDVVRTTTTIVDASGKEISKFVSSRYVKAEIFGNYLFDEDQKKFVGIDLYGTQTAVYNYDKDGKVISSVEKRSDMATPVITNGNPSAEDVKKVSN